MEPAVPRLNAAHAVFTQNHIYQVLVQAARAWSTPLLHQGVCSLFPCRSRSTASEVTHLWLEPGSSSLRCTGLALICEGDVPWKALCLCLHCLAHAMAELSGYAAGLNPRYGVHAEGQVSSTNRCKQNTFLPVSRCRTASKSCLPSVWCTPAAHCWHPGWA